MNIAGDRTDLRNKGRELVTAQIQLLQRAQVTDRRGQCLETVACGTSERCKPSYDRVLFKKAKVT
jgi:hypothetical protein